MESKLLLDDGEITRTLERLAYQILEKHEKCENIMLVGIERRGADLARRLQKILSSTVNHEVALGTLDINLYRDDWTSMDASPRVGQSNIPQDVKEKWYPQQDYHTMYIGQIVEVLAR